jgi:hypothetical protein
MTIRWHLIFFAAILALTCCSVASAQDPNQGPMPAAAPAPVTQQAQNSESGTQSSAPQASSAASPSAASASATAATAPSNAGVAPASLNTKNPQIEVPTGTHIPLVLHNAVSTRSARPGDPVYFETVFPVMVEGRVVIPAGSYVSGEITESKRPGRVKGRAELTIKLTTMILPNAYMVNLAAVPGNAGTGGGETVNNEGKIRGDTDKASDIGTVATTTGAGAGIGAIAGGAKGAGIGAGIGAVGGQAAVLLSRGPEAEMPRGTTLEAVLDRPIFLDASKVQFTSPGQSSTLAGPPNREPQRNKNPF